MRRLFVFGIPKLFKRLEAQFRFWCGELTGGCVRGPIAPVYRGLVAPPFLLGVGGGGSRGQPSAPGGLVGLVPPPDGKN
jgi:hypothetical protein